MQETSNYFASSLFKASWVVIITAIMVSYFKIKNTAAGDRSLEYDVGTSQTDTQHLTSTFISSGGSVHVCGWAVSVPIWYFLNAEGIFEHTAQHMYLRHPTGWQTVPKFFPFSSSVFLVSAFDCHEHLQHKQLPVFLWFIVTSSYSSTVTLWAQAGRTLIFTTGVH